MIHKLLSSRPEVYRRLRVRGTIADEMKGLDEVARKQRNPDLHVL